MKDQNIGQNATYLKTTKASTPRMRARSTRRAKTTPTTLPASSRGLAVPLGSRPESVVGAVTEGRKWLLEFSELECLLTLSE